MSVHHGGGSWIRREKRLAIHLRDGFRCMACGTDLRNAKPFGIALDHLTCKSKGGTNQASNLMTICITCNSRRGTRR